MNFIRAVGLQLLGLVLFATSANAGAIKYRFTEGDMNWPNGRVPYVFNDDVTSSERLVFQRCVRAWQRFGNIRFVPTTQNLLHQSPDGDYLLVQRNDLYFPKLVQDVNYAWIGRSGAWGYPFTGMQPMSIHNWDFYIVVHEMGHTLGFIHEQMRTDRDTYVQLNWDQINGFTTINFDKEQKSKNYTDYDYDSIMHYTNVAFRDDWKTGDTMVAIVDPAKTATMGRGNVYPPHPEEAGQGSVIGNITAMLSDGDRMTIDAVYGGPTHVQGTIKLPSGKALNGVTAQLMENGSSADEAAFISLMAATGERQPKTDAAGKFGFKGVPTGSFKVKFSKSGFSFNPAEVTFSGGADTTVDVQVTATNSETTPPQATITNPPTEVVKAFKAAPVLEGTASDTGGAGLKDVQLALDSGGCWWNWNTNAYGAPGAGFVEADNALTHATFTDGKWTITGRLDALPEGQHHLQVRARDFSDNATEWKPADFILDKTDPDMTIDPLAAGKPFVDFNTLPLGGTVTDTQDPQPTVTFKLREDNGLVGSRFWTGKAWTTNTADPKIDLPATVANGRWEPASPETLPQRVDLRQGSFVVQASVKDHAENDNFAGALTLNRNALDTTPPIVTIDPAIHGKRYAEHSLPAFGGTAHDPETYAAGVRLYFMRFVPGMNGAPNSFKYWTGQEWSDTPGHLAVEYDWQTQVWSAPAGGYRLPSGATELPDAAYKLQATAYNREAPQGTALVESTFYIATSPPEVKVTSPAHNGFAKADWSISGTVTDHSGTGFDNNRVIFTLYHNGEYWDGQDWNDNMVELEAEIQEDGTWSYPGTDTEASLPAGEAQYALSVHVKDRNGNLSLPSAGNNQIQFRVDATPPSLVIVGPAAGTVITESPLESSTFNGTSADASGQPAVKLYVKNEYGYFWSGKNWTSQANAALHAVFPTTESETWTLQESFPCLSQYYFGMPNGMYELMAVAEDRAGNKTEKTVMLEIDYNPVWLRPQDELARVLPDQTPPIDGTAVVGTETQTFTPWLEGTPGHGQYLTPMSFKVDNQGRRFVVNSVSDDSNSLSTRYHGIIQRLGPNGWRRQREIDVPPGFPVVYYERWSPDEPWTAISNFESGIYYAEPARAQTDDAGNTVVAYNLTNFDYYRSPKVRYYNSVMVVKFDADGNRLWKRIVPEFSQAGPGPEWLDAAVAVDLDLLADGSAAVVVENYTTSTSYHLRNVVLLRFAANGATESVTRLGNQGNPGSNIPALYATPLRAAVDALGNSYVMTTEAYTGDGFNRQVLRKIARDGQILATHETSLCKAPELWQDMRVDAGGNVFIVSTFDFGDETGRCCVSRYDSSFNLIWRAFGPQGSVYLGSGGIQQSPEYKMHLGSSGVTIAHEAPADWRTEFGDAHPLVLRFSLDGDLLWARALADAVDVTYGRDGLSHMEVTSAGDVLWLGYFARENNGGVSIYGKIRTNGDLQFYAQLPDGYATFTCLTPDQKLAALQGGGGSVYSPSGQEKVVVFDNPANQSLPIVLDTALPESRNVLVGDRVEFTVVNRGSAAAYQWRKEDVNGVPQNITGATAATYVIASAVLGDSGRYSCRVANGPDSATSRTATLTVLQPVPLETALDTTGRTWTTGGDAPWGGISPTPAHDGVDSASSGDIGNNATSYLETVVTGPAQISFWWKSSSEWVYDRLTFSVNGTQIGSGISGEQDWIRVQQSLGEGSHTLRWTFSRDSSGGSGFNRAWVDQFTANTVTTVPLKEALDNDAFTFTTGGTANWSGVAPTPSHDGVDSAASGDVGDNQQSWMETTVTGPGAVSFWWKVSSEAGYDYLRLSVDGALTGSISGEQDWGKVTQFVGSGAHTVRWTYVKDSIFSTGLDTGWVDEVAFTSGAVAPSFAAQPYPRIGLTGGIVTISTMVSGGPDNTFQWKKGAAKTNITGATNSFFGFSSLKTSDANVYWAQVTNDAGTVLSEPIYLGVATRGPAFVHINQGASATLTAAATMPAGASITGYQWRRNNVAVTDGTVNGVTITGATTKSLKITNAQASANAGPYTCFMTMTTPNGTGTGTNGVTYLDVRVKPVVNPFTLPDFTVSQAIDLTITATNNPASFAVSGLPAGVLLDKATGKLTGKPQAASKIVNGVPQPFKLKITASNGAGTSAPIEVLWTVRAFDAAIAGEYKGLVGRNAALNGLAGVPEGLGGTLQLKVAPTGVANGTLKLGTQAPAQLKGAITVTPSVVNPSYVHVVDRPAPLPDLTFTATVNVATGGLTGTVTDGTASTTFTAWKVLPRAGYAGMHHVALFPEAGVAGDAQYPQGAGYATVSVSATGTATWTAKLPDGTPVTGSCPVGPDGEIYLHSLLYTNRGSVQGWATINSANQEVDGVPGLSWYKAPVPPKTATRSYQAGIPLHNLGITGGPFVIKGTSVHALLGLTTSPGTLEANFSAGGLTNPLTQAFTMKAPNAVTVPANSFSMKATATSAGILNGTFNQPGLTPSTPRSAAFTGLVIPRLAKAVGFFTLPELANPPTTKATNSPIWSGKFEAAAP